MGNKGAMTLRVMLVAAMLLVPGLLLAGSYRLYKEELGAFFNKFLSARLKEVATTKLEALQEAAKPTPHPLPATFDLVIKGNPDGSAVRFVGTGPCQKRIESSPTKALVMAEGLISLGTTPFTMQGPCGKTVELRFEKEGYEGAKAAIQLEADSLGLSVRLKRVALVTKNAKKKRTR